MWLRLDSERLERTPGVEAVGAIPAARAAQVDPVVALRQD